MTDKQIKGKYYLQHYDSNYKDWYFGLEGWNGMNSCYGPFSPIEDLSTEGKNENIDCQFDENCTYIIEVDIKIHKMTKAEEKKYEKKEK